MNLRDYLAQDEVSLSDGDFISSYTVEAGYVPFNSGTDNFHLGRYAFKAVKDGDALNIVPMKHNKEYTEFETDDNNPVIVINGSTISYTTGRNNPESKDSYNDRELHVIEDIESGEEHRVALSAFLEFAQSEFSLGVNDFYVESKTSMEESDSEDEDDDNEEEEEEE